MLLRGYNNADPVEEEHEYIVCWPAFKCSWKKKRTNNKKKVNTKR